MKKSNFIRRLGYVLIVFLLINLGCENEPMYGCDCKSIQGCMCRPSDTGNTSADCPCCQETAENKDIIGEETILIITPGHEMRTVQDVNFKMRYVPSGVFMKPISMYEDREIKVNIFSGYWIGETEVTQELYKVIMGENPSQFNNNPAPGEIQRRRPIEGITFYEAVLFCNRLSIASGRDPVYQIWGVPDWEKYLLWVISGSSKNQLNTTLYNIYVNENANGYRLPTPDEWIWAAMGADKQSPGQINYTGAKKTYSGGTAENTDGLDNFAWHYYNSSGMTHEVGLKHANEIGLYDMSGNVSEITWGYSMGLAWNSPIYDSRLFTTGVVYYHEKYDWQGLRIVSNQ